MDEVKWQLPIAGSPFHSWRCLKQDLALAIQSHLIASFLWKFLPLSILQLPFCSVSLFSTVLSLVRISALIPFDVRKERGIIENQLNMETLLDKTLGFSFLWPEQELCSCSGLSVCGPMRPPGSWHEQTGLKIIISFLKSTSEEPSATWTTRIFLRVYIVQLRDHLLCEPSSPLSGSDSDSSSKY